MQTRRPLRLARLRILRGKPRHGRVVVAGLGVIEAAFFVFLVTGEADRLLIGGDERGGGGVRVGGGQLAGGALLGEDLAEGVVLGACADRAGLVGQDDG